MLSLLERRPFPKKNGEKNWTSLFKKITRETGVCFIIKAVLFFNKGEKKINAFMLSLIWSNLMGNFSRYSVVVG